jgi:dihydroflavonol-4-reductase
MPLTVAVTGATGFLGGHLVRLLAERGDDVRAVYRNPERLGLLAGIDVQPFQSDVLDGASLQRAFADADLVFHTAGYVGSAERAWAVNALAPRLVVEAAARAGAGRVVHTSSVVAIGPAVPGELADEATIYRGGELGLAYVDSKHEGEAEAMAASLRLDVDLVAANPAYVIGVPADRSLAAASSARVLATFLHGGMPMIVDGLTNVVDVRDVAAGHLLVAEHGRRGERYALGATNIAWVDVVNRIVARRGRPQPTLALPPELARFAHVQHLLGMRPVLTGGLLTRLAAPSWQYDSSKAMRELGYAPRPLDDTLDDIIAWADELRVKGVSCATRPGALRGTRVLATARRAGLLAALGVLERRSGRRIVAGA